MYYMSDYSQQDIATRLGVSRPTVSRLLQHAKEQGYVRISIVDPLEDLGALAERVKKAYGLEHVLVSYSPVNEYREIQKHISKRQPITCMKRSRMRISSALPGERPCMPWRFSCSRSPFGASKSCS